MSSFTYHSQSLGQSLACSKPSVWMDRWMDTWMGRKEGEPCWAAHHLQWRVILGLVLPPGLGAWGPTICRRPSASPLMSEALPRLSPPPPSHFQPWIPSKRLIPAKWLGPQSLKGVLGTQLSP